jgi:hypothetical protein
LSGFVIAQLLVTKNEPCGVFIFPALYAPFPGLRGLSCARVSKGSRDLESFYLNPEAE